MTENRITRETLPLDALRKAPEAHKYDHGHALVLCGGAGRTGAARLAARGALRVGAGLVTLGVPGAAQLEVAMQVTAIMLRRVDDGAGLTTLLEDGRLNALCLGPGLGPDRARALVPAALAAGRATVLDADALTAFSDTPKALFETLHEGCVLTPHMGEFSRLFPDLARRLREEPRSSVLRGAADRAGTTVLLKGRETIIAAPGGAVWIHGGAEGGDTPWLATAGTGDVLAGFIAGLLARGLAPAEAAATGTWLHARSAAEFGPGLVAEDLPETLPRVFRELGL
ncbi:NAD(P)H-hydrate dehydratase [Roseivivax sediminis]|nr:NAD(P)H-hydrate dehydratase [Roseivivax sediminis]